MIAAISVYINMVLNGRSFVTGYNQLLTLESNLEALEENSHAAGRLKPEPDNDLFVKALKPCTLFCYPSALVVTCVAVFLKIDPGYLFFHQTRVFLGYANDSAWTTEMIVGFLRSSVFFLALMETGRVWPLACMVHISYKMMISNCIGVMHRITQRIHECGISKIKNVALLKMVLYQQNNLNLVMGLGGSLDQTALFIQLQMTVICGIVTNFATLRFYDSLPFVIYHKMPFISLLLALCTNAMLKYCHVIADNSTDLRILLTKVTGWNGRRGYFSRKVAAIRGLRIYGGVGHVQILWIERGTKAKFFDFILNQTIDLLLAIPRGVKIYKSKAGKRAKSKLAVAL
ncbi:uncharacterized protein LOC118433838 [Folsomia candida]|nr:uncharacterized protein LOC118433838 [Folsomia candida]